MMISTIQEIETTQVPFRTREQAARLLEELRELYQSLSRDEQSQIRNYISCVANLPSRFVQGEEF